MVTPHFNYEELWELSKPQTISLGGGLNLTMDFSDGLTKEQWMRRQKIKDGVEQIKGKDGRILMPELGIF